jgi:hypothetical protein
MAAVRCIRLAVKADLASPAFTGKPTAPLPAADSNDGQLATTAWVQSAKSDLTLDSVKTATGLVNVDFLNIPPGVKRLTLIGSSVSTNGTHLVIVQLGTSSGFHVSNYLGHPANVGDAGYRNQGFAIDGLTAGAAVRHFQVTLIQLDAGLWVAGSTLARSDTGGSMASGGSVQLSGVLDRLRLTTVAGADTFDSGKVSVLYER